MTSLSDLLDQGLGNDHMSHLPGTTMLLGTTLNVLARLVLGTDGDSLGLGDDYIVRNNLECSSKVSLGDRWRQLRAGYSWGTRVCD